MSGPPEWFLPSHPQYMREGAWTSGGLYTQQQIDEERERQDEAARQRDNARREQEATRQQEIEASRRFGAVAYSPVTNTWGFSYRGTDSSSAIESARIATGDPNAEIKVGNVNNAFIVAAGFKNDGINAYGYSSNYDEAASLALDYAGPGSQIKRIFHTSYGEYAGRNKIGRTVYFQGEYNQQGQPLYKTY